MNRHFIPVVLLLVSIAFYCLMFQGAWRSREHVRTNMSAGYIIPSKFSRILALGNHGLLSDFLFLKTATFIGGKSATGNLLSEDDWQFVIKSLDVVTDLDPYFVDPYMLAEGLLAWDAGKPEAANLLLSKGMKYRSLDWRLPFFTGFNNFYFLKDYETASGLIMLASRLPESPSYLATLGARLAYYGGKSQTALLFLKEMLSAADDELLKMRLEKRLQALKGAVEIEDGLAMFEKQFGRLPESIVEMVSVGIMSGVPIEPYGGKWTLTEHGRVFSTSKFADPPPPKSLIGPSPLNPKQ